MVFSSSLLITSFFRARLLFLLKTLLMVDYFSAFIRVLTPVQARLFLFRSATFFVASDAYSEIFVAPNLHTSTAVRTREIFRNRPNKLPYPWTGFEVGSNQGFFTSLIVPLTTVLMLGGPGNFVSFYADYFLL